MEQTEGIELMSDEELVERLRVVFALPAEWQGPALPLAATDRKRIEHNLRVATHIKEVRGPK
jgi:hypothetical protein